MLGGAITGAISAYAGMYVAAAGFPLCNTAGIATTSLLNSTGTWLYTNGETDISISFGVASYNFKKKEWGYFLKKGNNWLENIGYGLGAFINICDIYRFVSWDLLTDEQKIDVIRKTIDDDEISIVYDENFKGDGNYDKENEIINMGWKGLNKGRGWAKSSLQHEYKHHLDVLRGLGNQDAMLDYRAYMEELRNAEINGLTYTQYEELISRASYFARQLGIKVGEFPHYTLKEWLRSIIYF